MKSAVWKGLLGIFVFTLVEIANATTTPWDEAIPLRIDAGVENPLVLFGFNPQPEPPPLFFRNDLLDPLAAERQISGVQPTPFILFLGGQGGRFSVPSEPIVDFDQLSIGFTTFGGQVLELRFSFSPQGDGDLSTGISDPLFFNPQPEPPPQYTDSTGFQFAFETFADGDPVSIQLEVFDEGGAVLPIAAVPLPPAAFLLTPALVFLANSRRCASGSQGAHS